ncbi:phosphoribosylglycinamide formyltransferase [Candidatus Pantoea edessiphila]|uniref:Phosphoribosylglycinamide formyltransferase n=1 Tax=Candidatus Pantoea edessiphila TaxID=2044610 RepID=A0A2P5SYF6_9GAMM|nr:phosphoribosylglycinamide formyltransferase [Candidatus Pantoea edessiphila]MBK4775508.1 phosphoribosylglycinamide formyltransferase [Pantoea sp. Edef]PPI87364.1 phosphoribosylglycinamide formyltransferase [Candidatus Pantoea edessiphila]
MKKIIVLISGQGSNLQSIINACYHKQINAKVVAVFSDRSSAYGLTYARKAQIPANIIIPNTFTDRQHFDFVLSQEIDRYKPDLIVLAGYMRILSNFFVNHFKGMIINIHPSLLPKYPGLNTHRKVLENGDLEHGLSVHFVTNKLDSGPIITQKKIAIVPTDNEMSIIKRIKHQEHIIYPIVIKWFIEGRLIMKEEQAWLDGKKIPI